VLPVGGNYQVSAWLISFVWTSLKGQWSGVNQSILVEAVVMPHQIRVS
jgi:hypothetical protein